MLFQGEVKACPKCGTGFRVSPSQKGQKYCSPECYFSRNAQPSDVQERICHACGEQFRVAPHRLRVSPCLYCSAECRQLSAHVLPAGSHRLCLTCGAGFTVPAVCGPGFYGVYCSAECRRERAERRAVMLSGRMQTMRDMLAAGRPYREVAEAAGCAVDLVKLYNYRDFKIDIQEAFRQRIEREGVPCRLDVSDAFGYWFSGFFDGEGHLGIFTRPNTRNPQYEDRRLSIRIALRDDDACVLRRIQKALNAGRLHASVPDSARQTNQNPSVVYVMGRLEDLAEIAVPLFDRYPLYTKKAKEYAVWRKAVLEQYVLSLGGQMNRMGASSEWKREFDACEKRIAAIRAYKPPDTAA